MGERRPRKPSAAAAGGAAKPSRGQRGWSRARRPEQKRQRRATILEAAIELLDEGGLEAASLSEIARRSKISKANLYRYFESREAILLAVSLDELEAWLDALTTRVETIAEGPVGSRLEAIADAVVETLLARPRVSVLVASLSSVLEHNVGTAVVIEFKRSLHALTGAPTEALARAAPGLGVDGARTFMTFVFVSVAGVHPVANPAPAVAEVLADPEFAEMCVEFAPFVRAHALTVLRGLLASP
ncbi:TetR/AcrR family transcriptional regulator [Enhygromyxa salina]|uniref:Putative HTH-type transcriptional regulator YvdT n=1 Tax=Enhygromyxa salina TaxID=215803 RepID=A0A2S9YAD4_9BACT|nr:TetR family transcriptional regulator [Enhygromyxa salina]PRQ02074.1 putative HTH-type transcriptional regulator YvdT [Enhygromyxa salina]